MWPCHVIWVTGLNFVKIEIVFTWSWSKKAAADGACEKWPTENNKLKRPIKADMCFTTYFSCSHADSRGITTASIKSRMISSRTKVCANQETTKGSVKSWSAIKSTELSDSKSYWLKKLLTQKVIDSKSYWLKKDLSIFHIARIYTNYRTPLIGVSPSLLPISRESP